MFLIIISLTTSNPSKGPDHFIFLFRKGQRPTQTSSFLQESSSHQVNANCAERSAGDSLSSTGSFLQFYEYFKCFRAVIGPLPEEPAALLSKSSKLLLTCHMHYKLPDVTMVPDTIQIQRPGKLAHREGDISFIKSIL